MKHYCSGCNKQITFDEYRIAIDKRQKREKEFVDVININVSEEKLKPKL